MAACHERNSPNCLINKIRVNISQSVRKSDVFVWIFFKLLNLIKSDHVFYCWGSSRKDLESVFVEVGVGHHHCKLQENVEFQTLFQFYIMKLVAKTEFCMHSRRRSSIFYYKIRICKSFKFCVLKFQNDLSFP